MNINKPKRIHPFLQEIINRIVSTGLGEVYITEDGHLFLETCKAIKVIYGALDMKKEGAAAGVRIVVRRAKKRSKRSIYNGLPMLQIYVLPVLAKNAKTMTDAERQNMELNAQALRMAHAVERDPEQAAHYHQLHEAHKLNPQGYKKLYPSFFGFLVATFRMQLAMQPISEQSDTKQTIRLCRPQSQRVQPLPRATRLPVRTTPMRAFRPNVRFPMVA